MEDSKVVIASQAKCDMLPCWAMEEAERLSRSRLGFRPRGSGWTVRVGVCGLLLVV